MNWHRKRPLSKTHTLINGKQGWIVDQIVEACTVLLGVSTVDIRAVGEVQSAYQFEVVLWNHRRLIANGIDVFKYTDRSHSTATMRRRPQTYDTLTQSTLW